jgi:hypothetical protein
VVYGNSCVAKLGQLQFNKSTNLILVASKIHNFIGPVHFKWRACPTVSDGKHCSEFWFEQWCPGREIIMIQGTSSYSYKRATSTVLKLTINPIYTYSTLGYYQASHKLKQGGLIWGAPSGSWTGEFSLLGGAPIVSWIFQVGRPSWSNRVGSSKSISNSVSKLQTRFSELPTRLVRATTVPMLDLTRCAVLSRIQPLRPYFWQGGNPLYVIVKPVAPLYLTIRQQSHCQGYDRCAYILDRVVTWQQSVSSYHQKVPQGI